MREVLKPSKNTLYSLCDQMIDMLIAIPDVTTPEAVVAAFRDLDATRAQKNDVFWELDTRPGMWRRYHEWHAKLRVCRNHPIHGRELFKYL